MYIRVSNDFKVFFMLFFGWWNRNSKIPLLNLDREHLESINCKVKHYCMLLFQVTVVCVTSQRAKPLVGWRRAGLISLTSFSCLFSAVLVQNEI